MSRSKQRPARVEFEKVDGTQAKVKFYHSDPEHDGRVEIEHDEEWTFGVSDDGDAELIETSSTQNDLAAGSEIPEWLEDTLYGFGLTVIRE